MLNRTMLVLGLALCLIATACGGESSDVAGSLVHSDLAEEYLDQCDGWSDGFEFSDGADAFEDCNDLVSLVWAAAANLEQTGGGSEGPAAERALRMCLWSDRGQTYNVKELREIAATEAGNGLQEPAALYAERCLTEPTPDAIVESTEPRIGRAITEKELDCYIYQYADISRNLTIKDALVVDIADRADVPESSWYDWCLEDYEEDEE